MKNSVVFLVLIFLFQAYAEAQTIKINKLPVSVKEFKEMRNEIAVTPEGGAAMFIIALKLYNKNSELGSKCLVIAADRSRLTTGNVHKGFQLTRTDMDRIKRQAMETI